MGIGQNKPTEEKEQRSKSTDPHIDTETHFRTHKSHKAQTQIQTQRHTFAHINLIKTQSQKPEYICKDLQDIKIKCTNNPF